VLDVLATLDLDDGGFGAAAIAAVFVGAGAAEATMNPLVGRFSDRRGKLVPVRAALALSVVAAVALSLSSEAAVVAALVVIASISFGGFYTPGMALVADRAEAFGLPQALAFGISNTVWAAGASVGPLLGGSLADATGDAVPYAICAALCALTLVTVVSRRPPIAIGARLPR